MVIFSFLNGIHSLSIPVILTVFSKTYEVLYQCLYILRSSKFDMSCSGEVFDDDNELIQIKPSVTKLLRNAKYGTYGHATVDVCHWTKRSFRDEGDCYKHKFYGISTHRCMEFSPAGMYCENRCVYCWRPMEFYNSIKMKPDNVSEPNEIVLKLMEERKRLIIGHKGDPKQNHKKIDESLLPTHYAISLSGEPTMYPKLPDLIKYLKNLPATKSIFLVTNGQEPEMLTKLNRENALPTQLYLSTNAYDQESFIKINRPRYNDAWERWNRSLLILSKLNTRTVLRITLIKGYNDSKKNVRGFSKLINISQPNFIEIKSYMHIGRSINRLDRYNMLDMDEIRYFASQILKNDDTLLFMDESEISRIVVLHNNQKLTNRFIN